MLAALRKRGGQALGRALGCALAVAAAGCELQSPWDGYRVSMLEGGAAKAASEASGGRLDDASCRAACSDETESTLTCFAATQREPPRATRTLECTRYREPMESLREVAPEIVAGADPRTRRLDKAACREACGEPVDTCEYVPDPPMPPPGARLVLCQYHHGWEWRKVDVLEPIRSLTRPPP
jgi:hypothetical protein